tara:strand:- start:61 stop:162 length:102 start_codon:yes stop_codon:yes gene_type:complete
MFLSLLSWAMVKETPVDVTFSFALLLVEMMMMM